MKKKHLDMELQNVPSFSRSILELEQYMTPANIASDIIFNAYRLGDIKNKNVLDLGCGTGIFSIGAKIMGAKRVVGIDIDKNAIKIAKEYSKKKDLDINFIVKDVDEVDTKCDTIIMNPPFGAQKSNRNADRKFIEKGFEIASIIYSLHLNETKPFIEKMVSSLQGKISYSKKYIFPIRWTHKFHKKEVKKYRVDLLRIET